MIYFRLKTVSFQLQGTKAVVSMNPRGGTVAGHFRRAEREKTQGRIILRGKRCRILELVSGKGKREAHMLTGVRAFK